MDDRWCILGGVRLVCGFFLFLSIASVPANEPGAAALNFLEKLRAGELDTEPGGDTALQRNTAPDKQESIRSRLERLELDLRGGTFELGSVKTEGDYAAVMVRKAGGFDSARFQVFPVALVRRGKQWMPAPVLASFENAVGGYTLPLRKRLEGLEDWMMRERVVDLERLIGQASGRMRDEIRKNMIGEHLEGEDIGLIVSSFLEACSNGNQAAVLGYLGGLSDPLPENWAARMAASAVAVDPQAKFEEPWRLATSPEVFRVAVDTDRTGDSGIVSYACLDPARVGGRGTVSKIQILHFSLEKDGSGQWRINLPGALLRNDAEILAEDDGLDVDLLDRFPEKTREKIPLKMEDSFEKAETETMEALRSGGIANLLARVDLSGREKEGRVAATAAAETWWSVNSPGAHRFPVRLGAKTEGDSAVVAYQWFSGKEADRFRLEAFYFRKREGGWVWTPGVVFEAEREEYRVLSDWVKSNEPDWRLEWRQLLLEPALRIEAIQLLEAPDEEKVREFAASWLAALGKKDLKAALSLSAWIGEEDLIPMKALRNLSYDLTTENGGERKLSGVSIAGPWAVMEIRDETEGERKHAFVPVIQTPRGLRVLPEIDFFAGGGRTRVFLNEASFSRLEQVAGKEAVQELRKLFEIFQKNLR